MKFIKKYELFKEELTRQPERKPDQEPSRPEVDPNKRPDVKPNRPSPIRRTRPAVKPDPKADKDDKVNIPKASIDQVIGKFKVLTKQNK